MTTTNMTTISISELYQLVINGLATHKSYYQKYCMGKLVNGLFGSVMLHTWDGSYYLEVLYGTELKEAYHFKKFI